MKKYLFSTIIAMLLFGALFAQAPYPPPYNMFTSEHDTLKNKVAYGTWIYRYKDTLKVINKVEYEKSSYIAIFYETNDTLTHFDLKPLKIVKWGVDPLTDHPNQIGKSPYSSFWDNPVYLTDTDARCPDCPDETYVPIAEHVYTEDLKIGMKTSNGWEVVGIDQDEEIGYFGALYKGTYNGKTEYIYATRGTEPTSIEDWKNNAQQIFGDSPQYKKSVKYSEQYAKQHAGVSFTGHSLGGGLASANALRVSGKAVTFNAAGLSNKTKETLDLKDKNANISAYVVEGEVVDYYQSMVVLKAEGNITYSPASYVQEIPFVIADDAYRLYQRVQNHMMSTVIQKFNK